MGRCSGGGRAAGTRAGGLLLLALMAACGTEAAGPDAGTPPRVDAGRPDAGGADDAAPADAARPDAAIDAGGGSDAASDAGTPDDADTPHDATAPDDAASDAGTPDDAGAAPHDATAPDDAASDAGSPDDAGAAPHDATAPDDAAIDAGPPDDAGEPTDADPAPDDAGEPTDADPAPDGGEPDAGALDAGQLDAGLPDAGLEHVLRVVTSSGGAVLLDPAGQRCLADGTGCVARHADGTTVTLTASAAAGFSFDRWGGDCPVGPAVVSLVLRRDTQCTASFVGTGGEIQLVPAPTSVVPNVTEDDRAILVFRERSALVLAAPLRVDVIAARRYAAPSSVVAWIPAGTAVHAWFIHFDPVGTPSSVVNRVASLRFPEPILGLGIDSAVLDLQEQSVRSASIAYPAPGSHPSRGLEMTAQDVFTLGADRRRFDLDYETTTSSDQVRILTLASGDFPMLLDARLHPMAAPPSLLAGAVESSTVARLIVERTGVVLTAPLDVDWMGTGRMPDAPGTATIPAGTRLRSLLLHFDTLRSATARVELSGVTDRPILGVVALDARLDATDALLGAPGTTLPTGAAARGYEPNSQDAITIHEDRRSFEITLFASAVDQLRLLLAD
jgi:hypothetical protein